LPTDGGGVEPTKIGPVQTQSRFIFHVVQVPIGTSLLFILHILGAAGTTHIFCILSFIALQALHAS
jgi:hypothetical protein